jgi:sodium-dependent dicarboxylate transporter 2/3/5
MRITRQSVGLVAGPLVFIFINFFAQFNGLHPQAQAVLACSLWVAVWWISEAVPIAATGLLPIVLFPLSGALELGSTTAAYGHQFIFLFMGGFILAIAIEKWQLHRRIALSIIALVGTNLHKILLGFMLATAFLSMWISNTAAAVMLLPVGIAIVQQLKVDDAVASSHQHPFGKALMLAIAYAASIGGMATLIGTPPNLVMAGVIKSTYGVEVSFVDWFVFAFPLSVILLLLCWWYLSRVAFRFEQKAFPGGSSEIKKQLQALGKMKSSEKKVMVVFVLMAFSWISRSFLLVHFIPGLNDTIIAIAGGLLLFVIPASATEKLLRWEDTEKLPWGIMVLFGGGMALAEGFERSGLALWIGEQFNSLEGIKFVLLLLILIASVNFLTEITSNLATTAMLLPVLVAIAAKLQIHPYYLLVGATLAASCAFMLPVATPPNAVVFGSGYLRIAEMVKAGFWMNVISILLLTAAVYWLLPLLWDLQPLP